MLAKEPDRCGAAADGWGNVTDSWRTPMPAVLVRAIRQRARIESSNTVTVTGALMLTGPDHRLAHGPVTSRSWNRKDSRSSGAGPAHGGDGAPKCPKASPLARRSGGLAQGAPVLGLAWPTVGRGSGAGHQPSTAAYRQATPVSISISITSIFLPITARQLRQSTKTQTKTDVVPTKIENPRSAVASPVISEGSITRDFGCCSFFPPDNPNHLASLNIKIHWKI
ncbi:hypothetical protein TgHK011_006802 [Trichoderma gracile]|nr:hypothetical protein TgHK011_006802 [Trichoderma gracile]